MEVPPECHCRIVSFSGESHRPCSLSAGYPLALDHHGQRTLTVMNPGNGDVSFLASALQSKELLSHLPSSHVNKMWHIQKYETPK
jgi:hypothetical protein